MPEVFQNMSSEARGGARPTGAASRDTVSAVLDAEKELDAQVVGNALYGLQNKEQRRYERGSLDKRCYGCHVAG